MCCLRGSQTHPHHGFRWSQTRIRNPFPSLARVVNVSSRSCHCVLWAALRSQGQVARWRKILEKKTQKVMLKIRFGKGKYGPQYCIEQKWQKTDQTNWSKNLGKTWQQWRQGIQGGGAFASLFRHAYLIAYACPTG